MEHWPSTFQVASLGGVGVLVAQPEAHLAFYGVIITTLGSIVTTWINRRAERKRDEERYAREREAQEFQAAQLGAAFMDDPKVSVTQEKKNEQRTSRTEE